METNKLKSTWEKMDSEINLKTISELDQSLTAKTQKAINKYLFIFSIDIVICLGMIIFLAVTALNRQGDILYQINNSILCVITVTSLIVSILSWRKLQNNKFNLSLKDWLEQQIKMLSGWLLGKYSKMYFVLIPVLLVMINLSIHVYYEQKPFVEVIKMEESIYGLVIGFIIGLFVSFIALSKIRKYQLTNLEYLKELHRSLCNEH